MNIRPNRVKEKLAAGQVATILSGTNDPDLIDQLGTLDVDGIWLEGEHGGVDYADLGNLTRACDLWGMTSVVRVMDNDYATIYRTLDRGAQAIVVPHVNTRREAEAVVEAAKFAPVGKRGMAPDDTLWLTDDGDHTVRHCTLEGKILLTIGIPGTPAPYMTNFSWRRIVSGPSSFSLRS